MLKKIKDVTFKEFSKWCNERACDGKWSYNTAIICLEVHKKVYDVNPLFGKKKKREAKWNEIKGEYFVLDAEIEV